MNINENNTIIVTFPEWNMLDQKSKRRMKNAASAYCIIDGLWHFKFHGITDKQAMSELCADFGMKVTG